MICGVSPFITGYYGSKIHLWNWRERKLEESIDLGLVYGALAMEVRFFHNPNAPHAYVVTGVGSAIFHVTRNEVTVVFIENKNDRIMGTVFQN